MKLWSVNFPLFVLLVVSVTGIFNGCASFSRQKPEIKALAVQNNGLESSILNLRVEEFQSKKIHPLLNYIFFEENSDALLSRYAQLSANESQSFSPDKLFGGETLDIYYQVLNIVGYRMRKNPSATIKLLGCNADNGAEKNNKDLAARRALAVQRYLINMWGIGADRITTESRNLPKKPSSSKEDQESADAENRRVEILADWSILQPVMIEKDVLRETTPSIIRFYCRADKTTKPKEWAVTARQRGQLLCDISAKNNSVPATVEWYINTQKRTIPLDSIPIGYYLDVNFGDVDLLNKTSKEGVIEVQQITLKTKQQQRQDDIEKDRYSLILFDFGSDQLTDANQKILDIIKSENRIAPNSTVIVTGFTDLLGSEHSNKKLAQRRAEAVVAALISSKMKAKEVVVPNKNAERMIYPPYQSTLPEERFHSRTVIIQVETPISAESGG